MTSFKSTQLLVLAVLATTAMALFGETQAMAQNHRQRGGNPNAVDILNGVGNMVGAIIRSTDPQNQAQRFPGYTRPNGYYPHVPGYTRPNGYYPHVQSHPHYTDAHDPNVTSGYYPQTTYYVPQTSPDVQTVTVPNTPEVTANPSPQVASNPVPQADITLVNPKTNGATLHYTLDDVSYSIKPGYTQKVHQKCVITFDRGGSSGVVSYTLSEGTYAFQPSEGAWELFQTESADESVSDASGLASNPMPILFRAD